MQNGVKAGKLCIFSHPKQQTKEEVYKDSETQQCYQY